MIMLMLKYKTHFEFFSQFYIFEFSHDEFKSFGTKNNDTIYTSFSPNIDVEL